MSGIIYELAIVEDRGGYWEVLGLTKNTLDSLANRSESLLKLSYMAYKQIQEAIENKKVIHINKATRSDEILPGEFTIQDIDQVNPLLSARNAAIAKIRMLVTPELAKVSGFALYGFMVLNNELINHGYVITTGNREEKYLEILETADEELISKLERYLNYKDEIERVSYLERKFADVIGKIQDAKLEDIDSIEQTFLENFYERY